MEDENDRQQQKILKKRTKYQIGNANKGGAAFNIINLEYERSNEGTYLRQRDEATKVRSMLRSKNIDSLSNATYNLVNGEYRRQVEVPYHAEYNPPNSGGASALSRAGAQVFGDGMAGRPLRGMDKPFGKRVASNTGKLADNVGNQDNNNINGNYSQFNFGQSPHQSQPKLAHLGPLDQPRRNMGQSQSVQNLPQGYGKEAVSAYGLGGAGTKFF